jgi:hypothetical protein
MNEKSWSVHSVDSSGVVKIDNVNLSQDEVFEKAKKLSASPKIKEVWVKDSEKKNVVNFKRGKQLTECCDETMVASFVGDKVTTNVFYDINTNNYKISLARNCDGQAVKSYDSGEISKGIDDEDDFDDYYSTLASGDTIKPEDNFYNGVVAESPRKISDFDNDDLKAEVFRSGSGYFVKYYKDGKYLGAKNDSIHDDLDDAEDIAASWVDNPSAFTPKIKSKINEDYLQEETLFRERLKTLENSESVSDRIVLIRQQIDKALESGTPKVKATALASNYVTPAQITKGLKDPNLAVRIAAISNPNATVKQVQDALNSADEEIRDAAKNHKHAKMFVSKPRSDARGIAIEHKKFKLADYLLEDNINNKIISAAEKFLGGKSTKLKGVVDLPFVGKKPDHHVYVDTPDGPWVVKHFKDGDKEYVEACPPRGVPSKDTFYLTKKD